jgi:glycosyltransferase involved in cell wall biosynthesis
MKITVLLARYSITGVPLAQMRLARALAARGHQVELVIGWLDEGSAPPEAAGVQVRVWHRSNVRGMLVPLMAYLRSERPDVVFSAEDHLNTMALLAAVLTRSRAKISGSSRVTPFDTYSNKPFTKRWVLKHAARALMWRADALTCVSRDMVDQYRRVFRSPAHVCVYNIVSDNASRDRMLEPVEHPWTLDTSVPLIVAAGRLAPWKGFDSLIRAIKVLSARMPVRLLILGDGPLRSQLQAQVAELGLEHAVQLVGYVENPLKYYARANVFALSSIVEGMPNVLVEAMMCGCTPVSTDCPTGPRELLQDGTYGYLVPVGDSEAMADAIERALKNPIPKAKLAEAITPFEEATVLDRHFEVLGL